MAHCALPGEIATWRRFCAPLAPERVEGVIRMLSEIVATCPECDEPVRRCDGRKLVGDQLMHLSCAPGDPPVRTFPPITTQGDDDP